MASLISTTTPLAANGTFDSTVQSLSRAVAITGSVFADEPGTVEIQQSGDGVNWDVTTSYTVQANTGVAINVDVVSQFFQVIYTNGSTDQTVFRLYVDIRDPYGDFLIAASGPSAGGAYVVLFQGPSGWQYIGRYDGTDSWNACGNAAISKKQSGTYAAIPVTLLTVSNETLQTTTEHAPGTF